MDSFQQTTEIGILPDEAPPQQLESAESPVAEAPFGASADSAAPATRSDDIVAASLGIPAWLLTTLASRMTMLLQCTETQTQTTKPRHIQFIGLTPGAGASTVAAAYAHAAMKLHNRNTLLLRSNYALGGPGILECVAKNIPISHALRTVHSRLSVGDLLDQSGAWQQGLHTLFSDPSSWTRISQGFDEVIVEYQYSGASRLDTLLVPMASGVVFVIDADRTSRATAMAACSELASIRAPVLGTVLNRCATTRHPDGGWMARS